MARPDKPVALLLFAVPLKLAFFISPDLCNFFVMTAAGMNADLNLTPPYWKLTAEKQLRYTYFPNSLLGAKEDLVTCGTELIGCYY